MGAMKIAATDWPTLSALFDEALELSAPERLRWFDALPPQFRVHRQTLEHLLATWASVQTQDFLGGLPRVGVASLPQAAEAEAEAEGRAIGPYHLLRVLGRGGMGSVWLAERTDGMPKRQVALKLPHPGLATRAFAERLVRERDILASLDHPRIAPLLDAGVSADGQPYIALAYVAGRTLTEHCREVALGVAERVELFRQVLDAVQYAHAHLVIHRDIKPGNVLVDERGQVHLLDFGIAKLVVDGQAEATALTLDVGAAMTPDYASPEQLEGSAISTASDIHALGVLLYELLAGVRPYRLQRQEPAAMAQVLRMQSVARPSTAAGNRPEARALRGDLDSIVLKAMHPDPAQRYASADAFSEDLRRQQAGEPVQARPDGWAYRSGKFLRRHRVGAGIVALLLASLAAGLAGTAWQSRRAERQAERAEAVKDFLIGLFREGDPASPATRELTASQLLDRGQHDLQTKLADQPRLRAELDGVLAQLYIDVNAVDKAMPLAMARLDLERRLDGTDSLAYADAMFALADVESGMHRTEDAYRDFLQARALLQRYAAQRQDTLLRLDGHVAYLLGEMKRFREQADLLAETLPRLAARFGPQSWDVLKYKVMLARADRATGHGAEAEAIETEIEPMLDGADAAHVLDALAVRHNLGGSLAFAWQMDGAARHMRRVIADVERVLGPDARPAIDAERNLCSVLYEGGHYAESAQTAEHNIERAKRALGADNPSTRLIESLSVRPLILLGRSAEAASVARQASQGPIAANIGGIASRHDFDNRFALALVFDGHADEAVRRLTQLAAEDRQAGMAGGDVHGRTMHFLAGALAARGDWAAALDAGRQAEAAFAPLPSGSDMFVARSQFGQAVAAAHLGQAAQAQALLDKAQRHLERIVAPSHPAYPLGQLMRAEVLRAGGQVAQAQSLDASARSALQAQHGVLLPRFVPLLF